MAFQLHPLIRLMRPALAPTAAADVVAAAAIGGGAPVGAVVAAAAGSVCLYTAGMIQNDLCDRRRDVTLHPDRPLVCDPALAKKAFALSAVLFAAGLALCAHAGAPWAGLLVAGLACAYNLGLKASFPADAITLGAARAANLWIGLAIAGAGIQLTYQAGYLLIVFGITSTSRAEDREPPPTRRLMLLLSLLPMALGLGALASLARQARALYLVPAVALAALFLQAFWAGSRRGTLRYVLRLLLGLFLIHAVSVWTRECEWALLPIAALAAASVALLKASGQKPPT